MGARESRPRIVAIPRRLTPFCRTFPRDAAREHLSSSARRRGKHHRRSSRALSKIDAETNSNGRLIIPAMPDSQSYASHVPPSPPHPPVSPMKRSRADRSNFGGGQLPPASPRYFFFYSFSFSSRSCRLLFRPSAALISKLSTGVTQRPGKRGKRSSSSRGALTLSPRASRFSRS